MATATAFTGGLLRFALGALVYTLWPTSFFGRRFHPHHSR